MAEDDDFDNAKLESAFADRGIGYVHDIYSTPAIINRMQRYMVERTRLGIPCIFTGEALHGISYRGSSIFPSPLNLGATFDPELVHEIGGAIGAETRSLGICEILAPNLDVSRDPRWGRTEETFGEDTFLSSRMAAAIISGEQKGDIGRPDAVISEPKHYCVHGTPEGGLNCAPARVGRREVETCYLPVFEAGIREGGAYNVMACYNSIDGEVVMASRHYLTEVLKKRLGLRGISRADWGGVRRLTHAHRLTRSEKEAARLAVTAGLDMQGCCDYTTEEWERYLREFVESGDLPTWQVDESVRRVLTMKFELGLFEHPYTDEQRYREVIRCAGHAEVSLRAARESLVLLKNDGILPFSDIIRSVALIGPSSAVQKIGGYSSEPYGYKIKSVYDELRALLGPSVTIRQCDGCGITENRGGDNRGGEVRYVDGQPHLTQKLDENISDMLDEAVALAAECDAVIFVGGDNSVTSGEGFDRADMALYGRQRELILRAAATGKPVIVVLENGKPVDLTAESEVVSAILVAGFGGEHGARAIAEALCGKYSPGGRLPISYPRGNKLPCYYTMLPGGSDGYIDGTRRPLYAFGHGLSYTKFEYSGLSVTRGDGYEFTVALDVTNTGTVAGDEVAQVYITDVESSIATPDKKLCAFRRVPLAPGESKRLEFALGYDALKLYNLDYEWVVEPGEFVLSVGGGSEDIRLRATMAV